MKDRLHVHVNAVGAVVGGGVTHLPPFLRALSQQRPSWTIHAYVSEGVGIDSLPASIDRIEVPNLSGRRRLAWDAIQLPRRLRHTPADAVVNLANSGPFSSPVPSILFQRNSYWFDPAWVRRMPTPLALEARLRRLLAAAQARGSASVIVPSGTMAEFLLCWPYWPTSTPVRVIPHAVDLDRFEFVPRTWPPPPDRAVRMLMIGSLYEHKDQRVLIEATRRLLDLGIPAQLQLTVASDDPSPYADTIRKSVRDLDLADHVEFLGAVDPRPYYASADIMLSPSLTESFGFPILEAMASGIPVVASRIDASVELAGRCAWFFEPGDSASVVESVMLLLSTDASEVTPRLRTGREAAAALSWERNANAVAGAIEAACAGC